MGLIVFSMSHSLDGYITDAEGRFDWGVPDAEIFRAALEEVRGLSAHFLGRRLYETMRYWEDPEVASTLDPLEREFAEVWNELPKIVVSSTLDAAPGRNTTLLRGDLIAEVARLRDYLASTGLHGYFQSYDGLFASEGLAELLAERFTAAGFPSKSFHDDAQVDDTLIAKLVFLTDDEDAAARALTELAEDFEVVGGTIPVAFAASGEVAPRGVHKGAAIQALLRELDLDPDDAVGIGDNWNDAEMFAVVGTSIAMGNAVDGVKALADQVTTAIDEDGLRTAFRRNGLI